MIYKLVKFGVVAWTNDGETEIIKGMKRIKGSLFDFKNKSDLILFVESQII